MTTLERVPVAELRPHPENERIYGDQADQGLVDSVRRSGVREPLLITRDGRIISGHRRWDAAKRCDLPDVPALVFDSDDEMEIVEALIEHNRQRQKTNEQLGREAQALLDVEAERAKRRQEHTSALEKGIDHVANLPQPTELSYEPDPDAVPPMRQPSRPALSKGKARDLVGQKLGRSGHHVERAAAVVRVVDGLRERGKLNEAERLRADLNKSVNRAWAHAKTNGYIAPKPPVFREEGLDERLITLDVWHGLTDDQKAQVLTRPRQKSRRFNEQTSTDIEWAQWSWNPVTGCKHDCSYCYARDIAEGGATNRNPFPQRFVPTFLPERLGAPRGTNVPARAAQDIAYRNVFTCSMADLFGRWVPREWIEAVLAEVRGNPQWNFLFLTKFPIRLQEFDFPENAWVGTTVDAQARVTNAERAFAKVNASVKWLSCEPLLEPLRFERLDLFQWMVIGGASSSTQTPEWVPPSAWVEDLTRSARAAGLHVYHKTNLRYRPREYPGQPEAERISVPDAFKMGYLQRDVKQPDAYAREHEVAR